MLSEQSRQAWDDLARVLSLAGALPADPSALNRFLVGVHLRGEEVSAHELAGLVDALDMADAVRDELVDAIERGLSLLDAYDAATGDDAGRDEDEEDEVVGWGDLVI